jgi:sugar-specific transcriptional regulator TrmB
MSDKFEDFVKLGLSIYQAKVYRALVSLGPSTVTEIHEISRVPRTKIYEVLEQLANKGAVEVQNGRPMIYRASLPHVLIKQLKEQYIETATGLEEYFDSQFKSSQKSQKSDLVWVLRGKGPIRAKLAEIIMNGKLSVFLLESYPPRFTLSVKKEIEQIQRRGISLRVVCALDKNQTFRNLNANFIEYRRTKTESISRHENMELLRQMRIALSAGYFLAVIDNSLSLVCLPNKESSADINTNVLGISISIPGVPMMQKIMFKQFIEQETTAINRN